MQGVQWPDLLDADVYGVCRERIISNQEVFL